MIWTPAQDAQLRSAYSSGGIHGARAVFPGVTESSIYHRAHRLGLVRRRRWTQSEKIRLQEMWGTRSLKEMARLVGHPVLETYCMGHRLGLKRGAPQGTEYLTAAARRAGFDTNSLRSVLRWAGVKTHRTVSRPSSARGRRRAGKFYTMRYVTPELVDNAIAQWMRAETVEAAARRLGFCGDTVRAALIAAGHTPPVRPNAHWRLDSAVIDAAMAARASRETIRQGALRSGVSPHTLSLWLQRAGVIAAPKPGACVFVSRSVVDRVVAENRARKGCRARRVAA